MVISNGSAKKRGRPGGRGPKKESEQRHPIDAGDDLERVRQPMRMEEPPLCGWKGRLHADGRALPMVTMIFEFLFANLDAKLRRRCGMAAQVQARGDLAHRQALATRRLHKLNPQGIAQRRDRICLRFTSGQSGLRSFC